MIKLKSIKSSANGYTVFEEKDKSKTGTLLVGTEWSHGLLNDVIQHHAEQKELEYFIEMIERENGWILGGLDWSEQIGDLLTIIEYAGKNDISIKIEVPCSLHELEDKIGKYAVSQQNAFDVYKEMVDADDTDEVHAFIGALILDEYIVNPYYVRAGLGKEVKIYKLGVEDDN